MTDRRHTRPIAPATDPALDARAKRIMQHALDRAAANDITPPRHRSYDWLADHGLLAVALLAAFFAGFVVGAIWQLRGGL